MYHCRVSFFYVRFTDELSVAASSNKNLDPLSSPSLSYHCVLVFQTEEPESLVQLLIANVVLREAEPECKTYSPTCR